MSVDFRKIGGDNNKKGNRYEDFFATYKILEATHLFKERADDIRFKEQAGCPVDDFVSESTDQTNYHQLKAHNTISWALDDSKLTREFRDQRDSCQAENINFKLSVVVHTEDRRDKLTSNMPKDLYSCTDVILFPAVSRPSDLAKHNDLTGDLLDNICAVRFRNVTAKRNLLSFFHSAWVERDCNVDGYTKLSELLKYIREQTPAWVAYRWKDTSNNWIRVEGILGGIADLRWWTDRGYFEWQCNRDHGIFRMPCDDQSFERFINRVLDSQPKDFLEFQELLP